MRALALALAIAAPAAAVPVERARVVREYPHDPRAFTEGLFWRDGAFYESTGLVGRSTIRKVDPASGRVLREVAVAPPDFGEGIVAVGREIVSLTWQGGRGYRWSLGDFRRLGSWSYPGEGWALTGDGRRLIMSDGTPELRFLDPRTLRETGRIAVTYDGRPLAGLNELEWVDGEVLANVWLTDTIVRIDPATGRVTGAVDLAALHDRAGRVNRDAVANGIAWDAARRRLFVTGKNWPLLFEIAWPKR